MADAVEALPPLECGAGGESGRSSPSPAASPEFEFWMVGKNPSFPSPALLTADKLFSGGVVLPLHNLQASPTDGEVALAVPAEAEETGAALAVPAEAEETGAALAVPAEAEETEAAQPLAESGIVPTPDLPAVTFKWKDIFKANGGGGGEPKERKKVERRVSSVSGNAELININIWPFSRSRSAGHAAAGALSRAKPNPGPNANASGNSVASSASTTTAPAAPASGAGSGRKVSSAPCSRSNSRGESGPEPAVPAAIPAAAAAEAAAGGQAAPLPGPTSMLRRLVPGHGRNTVAATGIRLGRPSPVWQLRRNKLQQTAAEQKQAISAKKKAAAAPAPAGDDNNADAAAAAPSVSAPAAGCRNNAEGAVEEGPNPPQGLFGLRTFFSKKVY